MNSLLVYSRNIARRPPSHAPSLQHFREREPVDPNAIYSFLFESYAGIGVLVGIGIVLSIVYCAIAERKTRRVFKDKGPRTDELFEEFEEGEREAEKR